MTTPSASMHSRPASCSPPRALQIAARVLLALAGGYLLVRHLAAAGIAALAAAGVDYATAWMLAEMTVFVVYLAVLLWAFSARRLATVAGVLVGGTALLAGLSWWLVGHLQAAH